MKKTIIVNGKKYEMKKPDVDTYMDYLAVRDGIMNTESRNGLYTKDQFLQMMESICAMYGHQFTVDELKDPETGLSVTGIIMEFALIEEGIGKEVDEKVEAMKANFSNGK